MKKFLLLSFLLIISILVQAQRKLLQNQLTHDDRAVHFGFCLGVNSMDYVIRQSNQNVLVDSLIADVSKPGGGFHVQIITNFRLGNYLDFRFLPGISLGTRYVNYFKKDSIGTFKLYTNDEYGMPTKKLESYYIELPLLLKFKAKRLNNFRPYLIGGANFRIDLNELVHDSKKINNETSNGSADLTVKYMNYCVEAGTGIDFYMPYFKLGIEMKVSYGLNNVLNSKTEVLYPQFRNAIESMHTSLWMLSFHFE